MESIQKIRKNKSLRTGIFLSLISFLSIVLIELGLKGTFYVYLVINGIILACFGLKGTAIFKLPAVMFTSIFWSSGLIIGISGFFALISIPIEPWLLWIPFGIVLFLSVFKPMRFERSFFKIDRFEWILLFFLFVSLIAHIYSVRGFFAPILHDPMSHAAWAKLIYNTGFVSHYYSPGLHILAALGMGVDNVPVATYVLIITNLFNAIMFIPVYYFIRFYFKNKWFALISSALFLMGSFPSKFFWEAGKNALIIAIGFSFFQFFIASLDLSKKKKFLISNILSFTLVLIHYPMAIIGILGVSFILLYKNGLRGLLSIAGGITAGLIWIIVFVGDELTNRVGNAPGISSFFDFRLSFSNLLGFFKNTYNATKFPFQSELASFVLMLGVLGIIVMMLIAINKKRFLFFVGFICANILLMFILRTIPILEKLWIVYSTQLLSFFIFYYIGAAFLLGEVISPFIFKQNQYISHLVLIAIVALVGFRSYQIYIEYRTHQDRKNLVQEADLIAFDWINNNLPDDVIILNNAIIGGTSNSSVFPSDAGGWLPAFSDREIAMPFTTFNLERNREIYQVYEDILTDNYSCDDINQLLGEGITHYYKGSRQIFGPQLLPEDNYPEFNLLFAFDGAKLFQILPCN